MRLRQPHVQRHEARLGAEAREREQERHAAHCGERCAARMASKVKCQLPPCMTPKLKQDGDGADVRDQQIQKARAADLGKAVLGGDEEIRGQRHRLPRHHERVRVVGEQHEPHAREEHVVLQAEQPGGVPWPRRKYPAANTEIPADTTPSNTRNTLLSASRRTCIGRSGNPMRSVRCSTGAVRPASPTSARRIPHSAPNGNRVRPASPTLLGRTRPASPTRPHTASSVRLAESGE